MNNPFDEYMGDVDKIKDMAEEVKKVAFLGVLATLDLDPYILDIFKTLIKHGCPVDTLIATLDELAKKYVKEDKPDAE